MKNEKLLLGLIGGAAVGAVASLLLAPDKGIQTRKNISKTRLDIAEKVKDTINNILNDLIGEAKETKIQAKNMAKKAKN